MDIYLAEMLLRYGIQFSAGCQCCNVLCGTACTLKMQSNRLALQRYMPVTRESMYMAEQGNQQPFVAMLASPAWYKGLPGQALHGTQTMLESWYTQSWVAVAVLQLPVFQPGL